MKRVGMANRYRMWLKCSLAAFVTSVALFLVLLQMEKNTLADFERTGVLVARAEIPKGMDLTADNINQYVEICEIDRACVSECFVTDKEALLDLASLYQIDKGSFLTRGMFQGQEQILENMDNPVIVGLKTEDLEQMVGGVLRKGDWIDIYSLNEEGVAEQLWQRLYVQQSFDSSGTPVDIGDKKTAVSRINVYIDSREVKRFYKGISAGTLRVVKHVE